MIAQEALEHMVADIVEAAHPLRVYVFGSVARGDQRNASDVDLLVVTSAPFRSQRERMEEALRLRRAVRRYRLPTDILLYSSSEFDAWAETTNHPVARVLREGRLMYERR